MRTQLLSPEPAPVLLFTGKGGVGKTTVACATAVQLAASGRRTLLVSTDPASNLDEVLGTDLTSGDIVPVSGLPGLDAVNVDPDEAARRYRERVVGPFRGVLPDVAVTSIEEQLSGACTLEVAAFDRFVALLAGPTATVYDHLVFDTAPTGHTLRLLELPAAWTTFLDENTTGTSCIGPLSGLQEAQATYRRALDILRDPAKAETVLVARPDGPALAEAARAAGELASLGIVPARLVLNAVPADLDSRDPVAATMIRRARQAITALPAPLAKLERVELPLVAEGPLGIEALRHFGRPAPTAHAGADPGRMGTGQAVPPPGEGSPQASTHDAWDAFLDELAGPGAGVILTMGKGGVGKSTVATALAVALARRGYPVHLTTTDPAGRFDLETEDLTGTLRVSRIDPAAERAAYAAEVMTTAGAGLDARGRALLEEDLRSPCTEEIAVFRAFAEAVAGGKDGFVVIDTAPTGHTLLLMDAAEAYHRDVLRRPGNAPAAVRTLLPRLRDPAFARVLIVTVAEATPVHEAAALHADLERAGVRPYAWVANQCLTGLDLSDPLLRTRQSAEARWLDEAARIGGTLIMLPWQADAPHTTRLPLPERTTP